MKLGWPSVEMMLGNMSMAEYVDWIAYFSVNWDNVSRETVQSPETIQANLALVLAANKKKKKK